ncbi:activating signal cointegrator 1 complex subunit 2 isoform X2 [Hyla sarda]|uniref:activating signal cointegrator 1 complex subunit 2 isoform X2 n=1 Tax=Hyla sarda TaxID=327740 RepID=UPI0024C20E6D|nr:activating signal cointegrator 1 complex subunit 2 isoform X2 [Hyla sarda]
MTCGVSMPSLPLDELQVTLKDPGTGKLRTLPALHPSRIIARHFIVYTPPPESCASALLEEFLERVDFILKDLKWLLALPYDLFWCQVIYDESLQKCLDSFLSCAPRRYDRHIPFPAAVQHVQEELHRHVFLTFLRMSTHKESKYHHMTPSVFGEILYNNYLFDIPKLLDICVLFGKGNSTLLQKMIGNIFQQQPSYYQDLDESVPTLLQVFSSIMSVCGVQQKDGKEPLKLEGQKLTTPLDMPEQELQDAVIYLCDTSSTIWAFLENFPVASETLQKHNFLSSMSSFYELCCTEIESAIIKRTFQEKSIQLDLWRRLSHSRKKLLEISHIIISNTCLQPILEHRAENIQPYVEEFLQILTNLLPERRFLCDYDELFPVADDINLLQQVSPSLDETRTRYLLNGVQSAWTEVRRPKAHSVPPPRTTPDRSIEGACASSEQNSHYPEEPECAGATAVPLVSSVERDSLVSQVKDLLPDLGEGFILRCLEEYGHNPESVINHLLEENLSPCLQKLDRSMPRQVQVDPCPLVTSRSNIFADDEFDVFSRDVVDTSRIWKGRRKQEPASQILSDKSVIYAQKERYAAYSMVSEEHTADGDYDDEYDDTYDGNQVGANDADSDDELISRRPFTIPRVLMSQRREEGEEEFEEEDTKEETVRPDHFVQDPAVLRERAEARRASYLARKGIRHDNSSAVGGTARGQGQSRETVQERRKKEANKGIRANHNRRVMADRKRNKGMIPPL